MQKKVTIHMTEEHLISFIKDLLCNGESWHYMSMSGNVEIITPSDKVNKLRVAKRIFLWLCVPQRLQEIMDEHLLEKKEKEKLCT